jgi:hypothetical protein
MPDVDVNELLERYKPHLIYDSQESYFADSAAEWTDAPTNVLKRGKKVLAAATPEAGQEQLSLSFLGGTKYGDDEKVQKTDLIGRPAKDYLASYKLLHPQERYRNRIYGRAVDGNSQPWLQYWFFYYYNDAPSKLIGYGKHEGDWEMIQLRLRDDGRPDLAVYAQHKVAGVREWADVQKTNSGDTPVVYVARGAHASYFAPARHWNDRADGGRPGPPLALEVITDSSPAWVNWPGRWGDTQADSDLEGQSSPTGPCRHAQWKRPDSLISRAARVIERPPLTPAPPHPQSIGVRREEDSRVHVYYAFPGGKTGGATKLLVTVNSPDDPYPPATFPMAITKGKGEVVPPWDLAPERRYEIGVSALNDDGTSTSAVRRDLPPEWP